MLQRSLVALVSVLALTLVADIAAAQRPGTLLVEGGQEGTEIFIDGELFGTMPMDPLTLAPGNHTIRAVMPGFTEFTDVFRIRPNRDTSVVVEMMAVSMALFVATEPEGVQVFVDGNFAGETPIELELDEGSHSLRLTKFGFHDMIQEVEAVAGQNETLDLALEALPPEQLEQLTTPPEPEWYEKPWVWALAGGALAAAAIITIVTVIVLSQPTQTERFCEMSDMPCDIEIPAL